MTASTSPLSQRPVICARCGTAFTCSLSGDCWCAAEDVKLPMPARGSSEDCLCRECLVAAAVAAAGDNRPA